MTFVIRVPAGDVDRVSGTVQPFAFTLMMLSRPMKVMGPFHLPLDLWPGILSARRKRTSCVRF